MNPLFVVIIALGVLAAAIFNYYLNWAPGADPDDFRVGPPQSGVTCDCFVNTLILGTVVVAGLMVVSSIFDDRLHLYFSGLVSFIAVTTAGILGRRKRYKEWRELEGLFKRVIPTRNRFPKSSTDSLFREFEEDDDGE
ncbi:hypothetical protein EU537_11555 [Candidatus Thorarchaeota archaeon]|nr:MAG: hypothetical protein EU537_11555 [Candidatus Thorarchaeota archaeon]